jgi:hypothetical protein
MSGLQLLTVTRQYCWRVTAAVVSVSASEYAAITAVYQISLLVCAHREQMHARVNKGGTSS